MIPSEMVPARLRVPPTLTLAAECLGTPALVCNELGYGILKRALADGVLDTLRATVVGQAKATRPGDRPPPPFRLTSESLARIYLPMRLGLGLYGCPPPEPEGRAQAPAEGDKAPGLLRFVGSLRPLQQEPARAFLLAAECPTRRGGIVSLGCGGGKTVVALHCAHSIGRRTLVVVHKEFLMHQWQERISQFLPDASVGRIQGDSFDYEGRDVVICMLQTLALRRDIPASALVGYGLVIVDECHHASAQVFSRALRRQEFPRSMGLSATIDRKDGLGYVFQWLIGPVVYRSSSSSAGLHPSARIAVFRPRLPTPISQHPDGACASASASASTGYGQEIVCCGRVAMARMVTALCGFRPRTDAVAAAVKALREQRPGCRTLVLSERRSHLSDIRDALSSEDPGADSAFYVGGMNRESLKAAEEASVILGTFSMAAEGMDIPALDTLVLATPKSDIEQAVGRIMRAKALYPPLVLDIVDDYSVFAAQARRRQAFYRKRSFGIERDTIQAAIPDSPHPPR